MLQNADDQKMTVRELLIEIQTAQQRMSESNPHRRLFEQCRVAIIYLVNQVPDESLITRSPIIMP